MARKEARKPPRVTAAGMKLVSQVRKTFTLPMRMMEVRISLRLIPQVVRWCQLEDLHRGPRMFHHLF